MAISQSETQVLYARYLKSGMTLEDFCKKQQVTYWDMVEWINQWEKLHGEKFVENSTVTYHRSQSRLLAPFSGSKITPQAQRLFPLEFEENDVPLRLPEDSPAFRASLELPKPGTIIKEAKLTFPSGMTIDIPQTTIKALILMSIIYEGNCIGID